MNDEIENWEVFMFDTFFIRIFPKIKLLIQITS